MTGLGEIEYSNGDTFNGEIRNNLREGRGSYQDKNGIIFNGYLLLFYY